jgi:hypothetical protein
MKKIDKVLLDYKRKQTRGLNIRMGIIYLFTFAIAAVAVLSFYGMITLTSAI